MPDDGFVREVTRFKNATGDKLQELEATEVPTGTTFGQAEPGHKIIDALRSANNAAVKLEKLFEKGLFDDQD